MKYRRPKEVTQRDWLRRMSASTTNGRSRSAAPRRRSMVHHGRRIQEPVMDPHGHAGHSTRFSTDPHGSGQHSEAYAPDPHGDAAHSYDAVEDAGTSPQLQSGTRTSQPLAADVPVGSRYVVTDEGNVEERSNGTSWEPVRDPDSVDDPHGEGSHDSTVATNPHGNAEHDPPMVANEGGAPQRQSGTRSNQPLAGSVPAGSEYVVTDEENTPERSNGTSWEPVTDQTAAQDPHSSSAHDSSVATNPHGNEEHDPQMVANEGGVPQRQSDTRANQPAADTVPVGSEYVVTDENNAHERSDGTTWESIGSTSGAQDPHDDSAHSRDYDADFVNDAGASPQLQADTRSNQPLAGNVPAGSRYIVTDENNAEERSNGTAWETVNSPHDDSAHSRDYDADFVNDAGNAPSVQADTRANQPVAGNAGNLYHVTDEDVIERDNGTTWNQVVDLAHRGSGNPHSDSASTTHAAAHESGGSDEVAHNDLSTTSDDHHAQSHSNSDHTEPLVENAGGAPSIQEDTRANQPVAVEAGRLYYVTDENVLERDTGTAWEQLVDLDHRENTSNPHAVEHSQVNNVSSDQHHAQSHGDADHTRNYDSDFVNDAGSTPSIQADTRANQPAAGNAGNLYHVTDEDVIERDNGTAWQQVVDLAHRNDTTNPHAVEHSQVNNVSSDQHHAQSHGSGDHDTSVADSPHGDGSHSRDYDADFVNVSGDTMNGQLNVDGSDLVLQNNGQLQIEGASPTVEFHETDQSSGAEGAHFRLVHADQELALEVDRDDDGTYDSPNPIAVRSYAVDITAGPNATDPINLNTDTYVTGGSCMHVGSNITLLSSGSVECLGLEVSGGKFEVFSDGDVSTDGQCRLKGPVYFQRSSSLRNNLTHGDGECAQMAGSTSNLRFHIQGGQGRVGIPWNAYYDDANATWRSVVASEAHTLIGIQNARPGPGIDEAGNFSIHTASANANDDDPISWIDRFEINGTEGAVKIQNADFEVGGGASGGGATIYGGNGYIESAAGGSFDGPIVVNEGNDSIRLEASAPEMKWFDSGEPSGNAGRRYWCHLNNQTFYVLVDRDDDGGWEAPHPIEITPNNVYIRGYVNSSSTVELVVSGNTRDVNINGADLSLDTDKRVLANEHVNNGGYGTEGGPDFRHNYDSSNDADVSGMYRNFNNSSCDVSLEGTLFYVNSEYQHRPNKDGVLDSGSSSNRWENIWAQDGTVNTSDKKEKTNIQNIQKTAASDRVRNAAGAAIQFTWANGRRGRQHAGFDADQLATAIGDNHAAYVDPSIRANEVHVPEGADGPGNGPKGLRSHELIPDLYAALADALDRIEQLEKA